MILQLCTLADTPSGAMTAKMGARNPGSMMHDTLLDGETAPQRVWSALISSCDVSEAVMWGGVGLLGAWVQQRSQKYQHNQP